LCWTTAAVLDNKLLVIGGYYRIAGQDVFSDIVYELDKHATLADQGKWRAHTARLNTARCGAAAITFEGKTFVCGGIGAAGPLRSVESFDPATGAWQIEGDMIKARWSFSLFVYQHELYAVGGDEDGSTTIEKRNKATEQWELVADCGQNRQYCAAALVGSKVFLFGGQDSKSTFDFFDLDSKKWASKTKGTYEKKSARQLPRQVYWSKAVLIAPLAALIKEWTDMNVVKLEDRDTARYNERFEAITGKAIQWDA
jgi:N-acetylneuraminic acid mutarotase